MSRPREFDADAALERAMQAFWAKGYKATSLDELCAATGLSRSSLYAAFGGKRALLQRSLDRYQEQGVVRITAALACPGPVRAAIAAFVNDLIDRIVKGPGRRGCFIGNCAAELARGEIKATADVGSLARFLVAGIQGLRLVGKANPDRATLEGIAAVMLRCLD